MLSVVLPGVGWLLNMGHRIMVVHRMQHGHAPWPAWQDYRQLLRHGVTTFVGMVYYYIPGLIALYSWWVVGSEAFAALAATLIAGATLAIPGYMSHYCRELDPAEIYNPRTFSMTAPT
jgi:hypothetical protein